MATYKAAFLTDLGKVLIDYDQAILFQLLEKHTGQSAADLERSFLGQEQQELFKRFCIGNIDSFGFYQECCRILGIKPSQLSYERFALYFKRIFTREIIGVTELLPLLRKRFDVMIMVTNTNDLHFDFVKQKISHVFKEFDTVIASHKLGCMKPEREIYNLAVEAIAARGVRVESALFVDNIKQNLDSAKAAGIGSVFHFFPGKEWGFREYLQNCWQINC